VAVDGLPNGRIVDVFCTPVPNTDFCDVDGIPNGFHGCDVLEGEENVNVEFDVVVAAVVATGG
jgi:hypothetical protein